MSVPPLTGDNTLPEFTDVILQVQPTAPSAQRAPSEVFHSPVGANTLPEASASSSRRLVHNEFFSSRESVLYQAVEESKQSLQKESDGSYLGWWLLTLVDHWDNEKERLLLFYTHTLYVVKYDFIGLSILESFPLQVDKIAQVTIGPIVYPDKSISPKVKDLASRVNELIKGYVDHSAGKSSDGREVDVPKGALSSNRDGIKLSWSLQNTWGASQLWNPWSSEIPWFIFLSHPLVHETEIITKDCYNVQHFIETLRKHLQSQNRCTLEYKPIEVETYVGIPALVHNCGQLGFYKVRGKISF